MCRKYNRQIVKILEQSKFIKRKLNRIFGWLWIFLIKNYNYLGFF
jgi:hypothetical protein